MECLVKPEQRSKEEKNIMCFSGHVFTGRAKGFVGGGSEYADEDTNYSRQDKTLKILLSVVKYL